MTLSFLIAQPIFAYPYGSGRLALMSLLEIAV